MPSIFEDPVLSKLYGPKKPSVPPLLKDKMKPDGCSDPEPNLLNRYLNSSDCLKKPSSKPAFVAAIDKVRIRSHATRRTRQRPLVYGTYRTRFRVDYGPGPQNPNRNPSPPLGAFGSHAFDREVSGTSVGLSDWMIESATFMAPGRHGPDTLSRNVDEHLQCNSTFSGTESHGFTAFGENSQSLWRTNYPYLNSYTWETQPSVWPTPPVTGFRHMLKSLCEAGWNELLSRDFNSKFEVIPFVADLSETVKMFTDKFPRSSRMTKRSQLPPVESVPPGKSRDALIQKYRDVHSEAAWGWLPLIGDIPKLKKAIDGQFRNVEKYRKTQVQHSYRTSVNRVYTPDSHGDGIQNALTFVWGTLSATGFISQTGALSSDANQPLRELFSALDMLGFHPDAATAWEIVPMSFLVDYFIPVGDALESLKPRGWTTPHLRFRGWLTADLTLGASSSNIRNGLQRNTLYPSVHRYYTRTFVDVPVRHFARPDSPWHEKLQAPSITNLFHTLVLSKAVKQRYL